MRRHLVFVASLLAVIPSAVHAACMPVSYVNPVAAQVATVGGAYDFTVPADTFDPGFPSITYEADQGTGDPITYGEPLPAWLSFEAAEGRFHGTPASGDVGAYSLRLTAFSGACNAEGLFTLTVAAQPSGGGSSGVTTASTKFAIRKYFGDGPVGGSSSSSSSSSGSSSGGTADTTPPVWVSPEAGYLFEETMNSPMTQWGLLATDANPVTYSLSGDYPAGLEIDAGNYLWSPELTEGGTFAFNIVATDSASNASSVSVTMEVNDIPGISSPATGAIPGTFTAGDPASVTFVGSDMYFGPLSYSLYAGTLPPGLSIVGDQLAGTPTTAGTYYFSIRVDDAKGGMSATEYNMTIDPAALVAEGDTCQTIKQAEPGAGDGMYVIDPDGAGGNDPFQVFCDMTTDGGGWTVVAMSTAPSTWGVSGQYALSHYDHYINDSNFTVNARKVLEPSSAAQWTWRAYDPVSVADMDVRHIINRADYVAMDLSNDYNQSLSSTPLPGWTINLSTKNYGCTGNQGAGKNLVLIGHYAYISTYCGNVPDLSMISLTSGNENYAHVEICSAGLRGYVSYGACAAETNTSDAARRVAVAVREYVPSGSPSTPAGTTCKSINDANPTYPSGAYWVDPDGAGATPSMQVYCDMTGDEVGLPGTGGWTLFLRDPGPAYDVPSPVAPTNAWAGDLGAKAGFLATDMAGMTAIGATQARIRMVRHDGSVMGWYQDVWHDYSGLAWCIGNYPTWRGWYHPTYCSGIPFTTIMDIDGTTTFFGQNSCSSLVNWAAAVCSGDAPRSEGTAGPGDFNSRPVGGCAGSPMGPDSGEIWIR